MDRLHELRGDFEDARRALLESPGHAHDGTLADEVPFLTRLTIDQWASCLLGSERAGPVSELARRYIIARDFNEYREGRWQMLWKLQQQ